MVRRSFTEAQKNRILADAEANGIAVASKKNNVAASLIYRWRALQPASIKLHGNRSGNGVDDPVPALKAEVARLQRLLQRSIAKPGSVEIVNDFREVNQ